MIPFKKKPSGEVHKPSLHPDDPNKPVSYINVTIRDASGAVKNMVQQKVSGGIILPASRKFKEGLAERVASAAAGKVPSSSIAKSLSVKLPKMLMYQLYHKMGMQLAAQTVFVEDSFFVIQFQVQRVDSTKLMTKLKESQPDQKQGAIKKQGSVSSEIIDAWIVEQQERLSRLEGVDDSQEPLQEIAAVAEMEEESSWKLSLADLMECIITRLMPQRTRQNLETKRLPAIVQKKITQEMQGMLEQKLAEKSLVADISVFPESEQARYFFTNLHDVRQRQVAK